MSNEIQVCVRGWVGTAPTLHLGPNGGRLARFRLGVTARQFDRGSGEFRDAQTEWFSVKAWKDLAENACDSLAKGTPVLVRGVLTTDSWVAEGVERSTSVITADSIGVELANGTARFTRTVRGSQQAEPEGADAGSVTTEAGRWEVEAELDEEADYTLEEADADDGLVGASD
ncbi:single-stranded DNA-binding protein [Georgenia sp. 10Sc9-8]|uniref:Single-stranded DNA-binding protein n=1 Tax=Georgenia halotolerans TaxID=3028317 RepID=A0ABT5TZE6_9MICO|nr:single-stranded DNA-binding protein [Georgenia halotolerans]